MPGFTDILDQIGLKKLFEKAEAGDPEAKRVVRNLNAQPQLTGAAFASPAQMDSPGLAQEPVTSLGPTRSISPSPGFGAASQPPPEAPAPRDRHSGLKRASILLSDLSRGMSDPRFRAEPGGHVERFKKEQVDALARRHDMWDTAFKDSQSLPAELLVDPKFAGLAQAKAALDKDMQDGKVDNEKNVSTFLTELARNRKDLDDYFQQRKISQQVAGEQQLQEARIGAGLAEPMVDVNFGGNKFKMPASEAQDRTERLRQGELSRFDKQQELGERHEDRRLQLSLLGEGRRAAAEGRDEDRSMRQRAMAVKGVQHLIESDLKPLLRENPTKPGTFLPPTEQDMLRVIMKNEDAIVEAARRSGIQVKDPDAIDNTWKIGDRRFGPDEGADALTYLFQILQVQ